MIHQLPAKPAYFYVKIWRRLQSLGAGLIRNAVYALPANDQTSEDFEWLLKEISEGGGEGMICEAKLVDGLTDQEVQAQFDAARDADYEAIAKEARLLTEELSKPSPPSAADAKAKLARIKAEMARVEAIDFLGQTAGNGGRPDCRTRQPPERGVQLATGFGTNTSERRIRSLARLHVGNAARRHVDRIASAWLIRRFIDPAASFKFVPGKRYRPMVMKFAWTCSRLSSHMRVIAARLRCCLRGPTLPIRR